MNMKHLPTTLMAGDFVRVGTRCGDGTRIGKDGLVLAIDGDQVVVVFGWDRFGRDQNVISVGPEQWDRDDLDLSTVDRTTVLSAGIEQRYRVNDVLAFH